MKTCCFTGHRIINISSELIGGLREAIIDLIAQGVTDFYDGGAVGWDMLCAETVIELKTIYNDIKLHLILPCPPEEQSKHWNTAQTEGYKKILQAADSITILSEHYSDGCIRRRNEKLVEFADCCICYCADRRSGTGQTIRMAQRKGIAVIDIFRKTGNFAKSADIFIIAKNHINVK